VVTSIKTFEGAGFPIARPFPTRTLDSVDPFLMIDHMGPIHYAPEEAVGAPWHPHRGFETVTYLLQGEMQHRDSMGNKGTLRAGDAQWMTAGSGIIHDEEPSDALKQLGGLVEGFQIWVNLPSTHKMMAPRYQDVNKERLPVVEKDLFTVKVVAGKAFGVDAVINTVVPIILLDVHAKKGANIAIEVPSGINAMVFVYRGQALFGEEERKGGVDQAVLFGEGGSVNARVESEEGVKYLLLAGQPLNEPVSRRGPFVMNTQEEVLQAFLDYQNGHLVQQQAVFTSTAEHSTAYNPNTATIV